MSSEIIRINREFGNQAWGFRIYGGTDFNCPIQVVKVNPSSPASATKLQAGASILKINGTDCGKLRHQDAQNMILSSGLSLELEVATGSGTATPGSITPKALSRNNSLKKQSNPTSWKASAPPKTEAINENKIKEALTSKAEVIQGKAVGVNFKKNEKPSKFEDSEVFKMLKLVEEEEATGARGNLGEAGQQPPPPASVTTNVNTNVINFRDNLKKTPVLKTEPENKPGDPVVAPSFYGLKEQIIPFDHASPSAPNAPEPAKLCNGEEPGLLKPSKILSQGRIWAPEPSKTSPRSSVAEFPKKENDTFRVTPSIKAEQTSFSGEQKLPSTKRDRSPALNSPVKIKEGPKVNHASFVENKLVNKQYNSPIGLYSDKAIQDTLSAHAQVLEGGAVGVNFRKPEKKYDADKSQVYKMLMMEEAEEVNKTSENRKSFEDKVSHKRSESPTFEFGANLKPVDPKSRKGDYFEQEINTMFSFKPLKWQNIPTSRQQTVSSATYTPASQSELKSEESVLKPSTWTQATSIPLKTTKPSLPSLSKKYDFTKPALASPLKAPALVSTTMTNAANPPKVCSPSTPSTKEFRIPIQISGSAKDSLASSMTGSCGILGETKPIGTNMYKMPSSSLLYSSTPYSSVPKPFDAWKNQYYSNTSPKIVSIPIKRQM